MESCVIEWRKFLVGTLYGSHFNPIWLYVPVYVYFMFMNGGGVKRKDRDTDR